MNALSVMLYQYLHVCVFTIQNMGGPLQPQLVQHGGASQSAGAKASLPSTWSDHSVNISLDFLGPGMTPPKPIQPSLNTLQQGEHRQWLKHPVNWRFWNLTLLFVSSCYFQAIQHLPTCSPRDFQTWVLEQRQSGHLLIPWCTLVLAWGWAWLLTRAWWGWAWTWGCHRQVWPWGCLVPWGWEWGWTLKWSNSPNTMPLLTLATLESNGTGKQRLSEALVVSCRPLVKDRHELQTKSTWNIVNYLLTNTLQSLFFFKLCSDVNLNECVDWTNDLCGLGWWLDRLTGVSFDSRVDEKSAWESRDLLYNLKSSEIRLVQNISCRTFCCWEHLLNILIVHLGYTISHFNFLTYIEECQVTSLFFCLPICK